MRTDTIKGFQSLFYGRRDAYGLGHGEVVHEPLMFAHYAGHLRGKGSGLGVFPLVGEQVRFAAIDLDRPDFAAAQAMREALPKPTFIERSRSGNAHVWVFFRAPIAARAVRALLRDASMIALGEIVEVFPKHDILPEGMVGNYINLPYHGADRPILAEPATDNQTAIDPSVFIEQAYIGRQDPEVWLKRARKVSPLAGAEPAGPTFDWRQHVPHGDRNNYMTSAAGFMFESGTDFETTLGVLRENNEAALDPPLSERELRQIVRSVARYHPEVT